MPSALTLIGAPCDAGANRPGTSHGPRALRAAGLPEALRAGGWQVHDQGDLDVPPFYAVDTPGYRHLPQVEAWSRAVHDAVLAALQAQHLPVLLGGDHSLAIGSVSAAARHCRATGRTLHVLWLDAHADCNTHETSPSGNLHGMPVACLCGHGPRALTTLAGFEPAIDPAALRLFGVRRIDRGEQTVLTQLAITVLDMPRIRALGVRAAMAQALAGMDENTHLHLSLDIDALDPGLAPGVSVPEPGGLGCDDMQLCMELIAASGRLGSLDVVEFNPLRELDHTAAATLDLIQMLFRRARQLSDDADQAHPAGHHPAD